MPWLIRRRIARICVASLTCGWSIGWASVNVIQTFPDLTGLPWVQVLLGGMIASWGGATTTLGRYLRAQVESRPFYWKVEVARDLVVSITVGAGAYFAGAWYGLGPLELSLALLVAGVVGAQLLTTAGDIALHFLRVTARRVLGLPDNVD